MNASYTVEPDMPPRERHTLSAHEHRLATPEPTPPDWDRGPLSFLRCPRSTYVLALVFALLALWLRFDPTYGAKTLGVGDASKGHALAWFTDADGAFAWTGSPAQREAVSWLVLALGLGLVVLLKAGRTRGVLAVFLAALGALFVTSPTVGSLTGLALAAGSALVAGALRVARAARGDGTWRVLAAGFAVLIAALFVAPGHEETTIGYQPPVLAAVDALLAGGDLGGTLLAQGPQLLGALMAILALFGLLGISSRWLADLGALVLVLFVGVGIAHAMVDGAAGSAPPEALDGFAASLHHLGSWLRADLVALGLVLAAGVSEASRRGHA
ncbi:MAG: hypothetical protein R3F05_16315 [Planctomycetota bacterium]